MILEVIVLSLDPVSPFSETPVGHLPGLGLLLTRSLATL